MGQVVPSEIRYTKFAENIIQDRIGKFNPVIARDMARRFETGKDIGFDKFFERHAILQAYGYRDGEIIHQASKGSAFFMHINENLAEAAIGKFACVQINLMAADGGLLDITRAAVRQAFALNRFFDHALDDFFDNAFCADSGLGGAWFIQGVFQIIKVHIREDRGVQRL